MTDKDISIHSLVKRETKSNWLCVETSGHFNPLPRKEGDGDAHLELGCIGISIHSLVKRETRCPSSTAAAKTSYFNPLPRKEGDFDLDTGIIYYTWISIHSLVKRETPESTFDVKRQLISIHSLVKRETLQLRIYGGLDALISIHSLVKRETRDRIQKRGAMVFQSTPS